MQQYHIRRSHTATGRKKSWDKDTYETIDWKHFGESFKKLSLGQRIQISKYQMTSFQPTAAYKRSTTQKMADALHATNFGKSHHMSSRAHVSPDRKLDKQCRPNSSRNSPSFTPLIS
jgi:hypothetical protein